MQVLTNYYNSLEKDDNIITIEKCNKRIKEEEKMIEEHNFNIDVFNHRKISLIRNLIVPFSESVQNISYVNNFINLKRKEFIEKYDAEKYKTAKKEYDLLKMVIEDDVLGHEIKYDYKITEVIKGGYECYYTSIYFTINDITFVFSIPHPRNISLHNCSYAYDGTYSLWYKESSHCLCCIESSYYINDIQKAFKEFIEREKDA